MRLAFGDLTDQRAARPRFGRRMQFPESSQRFDGRHERLFLRGPVELVQLQPAPGPPVPRPPPDRRRSSRIARARIRRVPRARKTTSSSSESSTASWRCRSRSQASPRATYSATFIENTREPKRLPGGVKFPQPRRSADGNLVVGNVAAVLNAVRHPHILGQPCDGLQSGPFPDYPEPQRRKIVS